MSMIVQPPRPSPSPAVIHLVFLSSSFLSGTPRSSSFQCLPQLLRLSFLPSLLLHLLALPPAAFHSCVPHFMFYAQKNLHCDKLSYLRGIVFHKFCISIWFANDNNYDCNFVGSNFQLHQKGHLRPDTVDPLWCLALKCGLWKHSLICWCQVWQWDWPNGCLNNHLDEQKYRCRKKTKLTRWIGQNNSLGNTLFSGENQWCCENDRS